MRRYPRDTYDNHGDLRKNMERANGSEMNVFDFPEDEW